MKTLAVRIDDDTAELLELVSEETGKSISELLRHAVAYLLNAVAQENEKIQQHQREIADKQRAALERDVNKRLGVVPIDLDHDLGIARNPSPT